MVTGTENGIDNLSSNSSKCCLHFMLINALKKDMNLFLQTNQYSSIIRKIWFPSLGRATSLGERDNAEFRPLSICYGQTKQPKVHYSKGLQ